MDRAVRGIPIRYRPLPKLSISVMSHFHEIRQTRRGRVKCGMGMRPVLCLCSPQKGDDPVPRWRRLPVRLSRGALFFGSCWFLSVTLPALFVPLRPAPLPTIRPPRRQRRAGWLDRRRCAHRTAIGKNAEERHHRAGSARQDSRHRRQVAGDRSETGSHTFLGASAVLACDGRR